MVNYLRSTVVVAATFNLIVSIYFDAVAVERRITLIGMREKRHK
mgnify:CR=1 FL=1|jgi:hypothetical protein